MLARSIRIGDSAAGVRISLVHGVPALAIRGAPIVLLRLLIR